MFFVFNIYKFYNLIAENAEDQEKEAQVEIGLLIITIHIGDAQVTMIHQNEGEDKQIHVHSFYDARVGTCDFCVLPVTFLFAFM